jgi:Fur family transcriptional regulator, ferric uptake regulator
MVSTAELKVALRQRGLRMTPQRQLILDVVGSMPGHFAADDVHQQTVRVFPDVNISTVYRTLEVLEELGVVRHTHFHDGVAQYERADAARHQHMVCSRCGADVELELEVLQPLAEELKRRYGFEADLSHSAITGLCSQCASQL